MALINSISFNGNLTRQTGCRLNNKTKKIEDYEATRDEIIKTYDNKIAELEAHKQFAINFDDLMFKDPDIQEAIEELPKDVSVELAEKYDEHELDPMLIAIGNRKNYGAMFCKFEDGVPDKEQVLEWLNEVKQQAEE